jgi:hypothetical protein
MFFSSAWCTDTEASFKQNVPLDLLGESIKRFDSQLEFTIVMLEGMDKLSNHFLYELSNADFLIIDYTEQFKKIVSRFPNIDKWFNRYERNCFLRWIAFKEILEGRENLPKQFWHLDIDVVLHTSLDELAEDTKGKTFMLQGCPVFVSVSNFAWFEIYQQSLMEFENDITGYSNRAFSLKATCVKNDMNLANQSLFRNPIGSDQDLLEFLVSSRRIFQQTSSEIFDSKYYFIQNSLSISTWHDLQQGTGFFFNGQGDGQITIDKKKVPFIHYQNTFVMYASVYLKLKKLLLSERLIKRIMKYNIRNEKFKTNAIFKLIAKATRMTDLRNGRWGIVRKFSEGNRSQKIAALLNFLLAQGE